jgi:tRNA threonylcarbamoyladenosine biosynthesis protein TsaB
VTPLVVLAVDTAGPVVGAALLGHPDGPRTWSARVNRGSDKVLTPALAELLEGVERLDRIAVSVGPGAFTSLRVGVAAALGLAVARGCPVVPVSSLEARAACVGSGRVLALLDGRKSKAYAGLYVDGVLVGDEVDRPPAEAMVLGGGDFVATGEGAVVFQDAVLAAGGTVAPDADASPALAIARLAVDRPTVPPEAVRLRYLRDADAKLPGKKLLQG